jgi:hypothetical protein
MARHMVRPKMPIGGPSSPPAHLPIIIRYSIPVSTHQLPTRCGIFHLEGLLRGPARRNLPADEKPEEAKSNDADNAEHHHNTGLAGGEVVASDESVADGRHFEVGNYIL